MKVELGDEEGDVAEVEAVEAEDVAETPKMTTMTKLKMKTTKMMTVKMRMQETDIPAEMIEDPIAELVEAAEGEIVGIDATVVIETRRRAKAAVAGDETAVRTEKRKRRNALVEIAAAEGTMTRTKEAAVDEAVVIDGMRTTAVAIAEIAEAEEMTKMRMTAVAIDETAAVETTKTRTSNPADFTLRVTANHEEEKTANETEMMMTTTVEKTPETPSMVITTVTTVTTDEVEIVILGNPDTVAEEALGEAHVEAVEE